MRKKSMLCYLLLNLSPLYANRIRSDQKNEFFSTPANIYAHTSTQTRFQAFRTIEQHYIKNIEPLFKKACYDCHTNLTSYPWYYKVPFIKQWIDVQVHEGQKSLTLLTHFPFLSAENSPEKDLINIGRSIQQKSMPPLEYRLLNPQKTLTTHDIQKIHKWIRQSLEVLQTTSTTQSQQTKTKKMDIGANHPLHKDKS
ncbi:MAG: heme-binding domain-containing protein [Oligoflexales bacterium]